MVERDHQNIGSPTSGAARSHFEIAQIMGERGYPMTRQRVQQIEQAALEKLREALREYAVEYFQT